MKIIYITTAIREDDYRDFMKIWSKAPNPSNQNFHNKLIRSLAINHEVEVISIRPFSKKFCNVRYLKKDFNEDQNIYWHYLTIKRGKFSKISTVTKETKIIAKEITDINDCIILTDTINPICIRTATMVSRIHNIPIVGVCTDSPSNISGTNRAYTLYLLKQATRCYGYIALTTDLNELFNPNHKPSIIIEGIVEKLEKDANMMSEKSPYFFFGGALLEKYGVFNLIKAFKMLNKPELDLYLCGHSGSNEKITEEIKDYPNIHFLGTLPVVNVLHYEMYALANINPRPYTLDLDKLSIPSKTLEYLASGALTISVRNTKLQKYFDEDAIWAKSGSPEDLYVCLEKALSLSKKERKEIAERAKEKALEIFSLDSVNIKVSEFLTLFESKVN